MRFVEGETLARAIAIEEGRRELHASRVSSSAKGRESALRVADLLAKVARALHAAHEEGVVHRDIKPSNVIVQPTARRPARLRARDHGGERTVLRDATGEAPGTPAYLAPEILAARSRGPTRRSTSTRSASCSTSALALRRPFDAPTRAALYRAILAAGRAARAR
jgi:serine/threonine protein kinase